MYQLKKFPEDFIVKEVSSVEIKEKGRFAYFTVRKKSWNTLDVVKKLAKIWNIREKDIGFAGSKDKHAVTEQVMSVLNAGKERIEKVSLKDVSLEFLGYGDERVTLGMLKGNEFEIVVRDVSEWKDVSFVANYFDEQRFGSCNKDVGKALVMKDFKEACRLLELEVSGNDYVAALRKISLRLLRLYVNSFQSFMWNEVVKRYLAEKAVKKSPYSLGEFVFVDVKEDLKVPLVGFDSALVKGELKEIVLEVMKEEGVTFRDFVIKQIPELSLEGELRAMFVDVTDFSAEKVDEGVKVLFFLPKGSYATVVVRKVFG